MKNSKRIVARVEVCVYEDGSVETKVLPLLTDTEENISNRFLGCSASTQQIVMVLEEVLNDQTGRDVHFLVTEAINKVAAKLGMTPASVHSKLTRKLGVTMEEFKAVLKEYRNKTNTRFEELILRAATSKTSACDIKILNEVLTKF